MWLPVCGELGFDALTARGVVVRTVVWINFLHSLIECFQALGQNEEYWHALFQNNVHECAWEPKINPKEYLPNTGQRFDTAQKEWVCPQKISQGGYIHACSLIFRIDFYWQASNWFCWNIYSQNDVLRNIGPPYVKIFTSNMRIVSKRGYVWGSLITSITSSDGLGGKWKVSGNNALSGNPSQPIVMETIHYLLMS